MSIQQNLSLIVRWEFHNVGIHIIMDEERRLHGSIQTMIIIPSISDIEELFTEFSAMAQAIYDKWSPDENGIDKRSGCKGISRLLSDGLASLLHDSLGHKVVLFLSGGERCSLVAALLEGVYLIGVPPVLYAYGRYGEKGKREDVIFEENCLRFKKLSDDPTNIYLYVPGAAPIPGMDEATEAMRINKEGGHKFI
jgi:hypothetical protein